MTPQRKKRLYLETRAVTILLLVSLLANLYWQAESNNAAAMVLTDPDHVINKSKQRLEAVEDEYNAALYKRVVKLADQIQDYRI